MNISYVHARNLIQMNSRKLQHHVQLDLLLWVELDMLLNFYLFPSIILFLAEWVDFVCFVIYINHILHIEIYRKEINADFYDIKGKGKRYYWLLQLNK